MSGTDIIRSTAGSVWPAAAPKVKPMAGPVSCITAKAGWPTETTSARHYDKNMAPDLGPFRKRY